ncbi:MAG: type II secretion system F family protein [Actinomycetes bacterium]
MNAGGIATTGVMGSLLVASARSVLVRRWARAGRGHGRRLANRLGGRRRRRAIQTAVPGLTRALADGVAAGETFVDSARSVGRAGDGPGSRALRKLATDCERGSSVDLSLSRLTSGPHGDLWAPAAFSVAIHQRCGGDLTRSLRAVASAGESAQRARDEARAATAQARFTANLVCSMPVLALLGLGMIAPERMLRICSNPLSALMLVVAGVLQGIGLLVIRRLAVLPIR